MSEMILKLIVIKIASQIIQFILLIEIGKFRSQQLFSDIYIKSSDSISRSSSNKVFAEHLTVVHALAEILYLKYRFAPDELYIRNRHLKLPPLNHHQIQKAVRVRYR